jgi:hypothetical protein
MGLQLDRSTRLLAKGMPTGIEKVGLLFISFRKQQHALEIYAFVKEIKKAASAFLRDNEVIQRKPWRYVDPSKSLPNKPFLPEL